MQMNVYHGGFDVAFFKAAEVRALLAEVRLARQSLGDADLPILTAIAETFREQSRHYYSSEPGSRQLEFDPLGLKQLPEVNR